MSRVVWLFATCLLSAAVMPAAPCVSGSLSSYLALGSVGCTVGNNTFSDFIVRSPIAGATPIGAAVISILPTGGMFDPGLNISVGVNAQAGDLFEAIFSYRLSGSSYVGSLLSLAASSSSGDGAVTGIENYCRGGSFGPNGVTGCTGTAGSLTTLSGVQATDSRTFASTSFLAVTNDFTFDGGITGSAAGGLLSNRFTAVPEPGLALLTIAGFLVLAGLATFRPAFTK